MSETIILDTNIILRFLIEDIPDQHKRAKQVIDSIIEGKIKAKISVLVIGELVWILGKYYQLRPVDFVSEIINLLLIDGISILEIKDQEAITLLKIFEQINLDWTDIYLAFIANTRDYKLSSFDKRLISHASGYKNSGYN